MSEPGSIPQPTELVYGPRPSWAPALVAVGIAFVVIGLFTWWPYAAIGGIVALSGIWRWIKDDGAEIAELPRRQQADTAPIPLTSRRPPAPTKNS